MAVVSSRTMSTRSSRKMRRAASLARSSCLRITGAGSLVISHDSCPRGAAGFAGAHASSPCRCLPSPALWSSGRQTRRVGPVALSDPEFRAATDTIEHEFYQVAFRKTLYHSLDQLQQDLDAWLDTYSNGIDAHWKAKHAGTVMPYEDFWEGISNCRKHRA